MNEQRDSEELGTVAGEARWPMAGAILAAMVLTVLLPEGLRLGPNWALPAIEGALLLTLIIADPGEITRRARWLRVVGLGLVAILGISAMAATSLLIWSLVEGGAETDSAGELLLSATAVWVSNNIVFALLYWELDSGGAAARAHGLSRHPGIAFPQQTSPHLAPSGWRPRFVDYLYLGFTTATAFSPTDAMPLAPGIKIAMAIQAFISLAILGLVVAGAVNVIG
jgi:uncharacterized membrane protein